MSNAEELGEGLRKTLLATITSDSSLVPGLYLHVRTLTDRSEYECGVGTRLLIVASISSVGTQTVSCSTCYLVTK